MEAVAKLRNYPTSPRKMRLIADLIRGMKVDKALAVLEHNPKHSSEPVRKLLLSAISNWKQKNDGGDETGLYVTTIFVDGARTLKRMRPAPQGRGYKIRKRSNHVTLMVNDQPTAKEIKKTAAKKTYSSKDKSNKENNNSKTLASETK
jgi:large subunit ribosomal protein L22